VGWLVRIGESLGGGSGKFGSTSKMTFRPISSISRLFRALILVVMVDWSLRDFFLDFSKVVVYHYLYGLKSPLERH
jgi:hypothetical protein